MATTKYEVFTRYFNEVASTIVENPSDVKWISSERWRELTEFSFEWDALLASPVEIDIHNCFALLNNNKLTTHLGNSFTSPQTVTIKESQYPDCFVFRKETKTMEKIRDTIEVTYYSYDQGPYELVQTAPTTKSVAVYKLSKSPQDMKYMAKDPDDFDLVTKEATEGYDQEIYGEIKYYTVDEGYYDIVSEVRERWLEKDTFEKKYKKGLASREEIAVMRPSAAVYDESEDMKYYQDVIDETNSGNQKYNFVFVYDGLVKYYPKYPGNATYKNFWIYDRMKRVELDPWFLYSVHASLESALEKAEQLVQKISLKAIRIGKIVELDQYIDIY